MIETEAAWLACSNSQEMAFFLHYRYEKHKRRQLDLVACACLRRIWHLLTDERCRGVVGLLEQEAEGGLISDESYFATHRAALDAWDALSEEADVKKYSTPLLCAIAGVGLAAYHAIDGDVQCVRNAAHAAAGFATGTIDEKSPDYKAALADEMTAQIQLMRCIFGNPFHVVAVDKTWLTPKVVALAQTAYEQRNLPAGTLDSGHLLVVADALQEAGCTDASILDHCRGPGPHVRGCWVVDLLLGKK